VLRVDSFADLIQILNSSTKLWQRRCWFTNGGVSPILITGKPTVFSWI